jgi:excinuclease UvrABC nuclease subunit
VGEGLGVRVVIRNRDRPTPCLDYHLKQCSAPCIGCVTPEEYHRTSIEGVIDFLKGRTEDALSLLSERMRTAARDRKFEQAAKLRDALQTIRRLSEKQIVSDTSGEDADVFGAAVELNRVHVVLLKERDGKVIDESSFTLIGHAESAGEALLEFLPQYYMDAPDVPPLIVLPEEIEGRTLLEKWLTERRGSRVAIHVPERGKKGKLLELAEENAREKVQQFETRWEVAARNVADALKELKDTLGLPTTPKRIEAFDISHLGGTETVGSMSVFIDGKPKNDQYRSFTIKTMREGEIDDYRALQEVLRRRFLHLTQNLQQEQREWKKKGIAFGKVRKNDRERILRIHKEHHREINDEDIDFARYLIARHGDDIIGFCRTVEHAGGHRELKSLWVHEDFRGQRLGQFLVRKMLAMQKKTRKVYIAAKTPLVEYYGILGFRLAHHPPQIIVRKHERAARKKGVPPGIVMVYIFAEHKKDDASLCSRPDLLLIDGGKGQLNAAQAVVKELKQQIPVIALAKKEEEIFTSGSPKPLPFPKDSPARFLLMRLRDEAHRFANQHRETRLKKRAVFSAIDALPGIGPQTKVKLLKKFGSLKAIEAASDEELSTILSQSQLKTFRNQL